MDAPGHDSQGQGSWLRPVWADCWPLALAYRPLPFFLALALSGCAVPETSNDLPSDGMAAARKLYVGKCAKCHKLYNPAKYSDEEWAKWMRKMSKKSKLNPQQQELLSAY